MSAGWIVALLLRLILAVVPGHAGDLAKHLVWSRRLAFFGTAGFYTETQCNLPPAYLYPLWGVGWLYRRLTPSFEAGLLAQALLKAPALLADVGVAVLLGRWVQRRWGSREARVVRAAWLFNPGVWITSAVWGQVDAILMLWLLGAALGLLEPAGRRGWIGGAMALGCALMTKPQAVLLMPLLAVWVWRQARWPRRVGILAVTICTVIGLCVPFVGLHTWDLIRRLYLTTVDLFPVTSANAFNLWAIFGMWSSDRHTLLGISCFQWGLGVFGAASAWLLWHVWRWPHRPLYLIVAGLTVLGAFVWLTRMHERYAYYALPFLLLSALETGQPVWWRLYAALSATLTANLLYVLYTYDPFRPFVLYPITDVLDRLFAGGWLTAAFAVANVVIWVVGMRACRALVRSEHGSAWKGRAA